MKKNAMDSQQVVSARLKHRSLLQDYLQLRKDFVSKERQLQMNTQKKETLLAELRFLRRRHRYLVEMQSLKQEMEGGSVPHQNTLIQVKLQGTDATLRKRSTFAESDSFQVGEKVNKGKKGQEESFKKPLGGKRKAQNGLMNEKITGKKKKISWQDPVAVNV